MAERREMFTRGDYAEFRGNKQMIQRMKLQETLRAMTPEQRAAYDKMKREGAIQAAAAKALLSTFKYTNIKTITKAKTNPNIEKLRALSLDDANPEQMLLFNQAIPMYSARGQILGKFRFNWGANGKPVYVPFTRQFWENFFRHPQRGRWIPNQPFTAKCDANWETHWIGKYVAESENSRRHFRNTDYRHIYQTIIGGAICKAPKKSLWVKIRKGVADVGLIVAAVYLGPAIVAIGKALLGGAAGGGGTGTGAAGAAATGGTSAASTAATTATTFQKVQAGTKTLLGYVNKARTVRAVVRGELPPPPIGIPGASFRDWALIVAKEKIKEEAMDAAMEAGQKYIAKKMSAKEEAKLKAEIAEMQRQLIALTPKEVLAMPPEPMAELAAPIKKIQVIEVERKNEFDQFIIPGAIVAGALILGG